MKGKKPELFLAHPRTIAAFGQECSALPDENKASANAKTVSELVTLIQSAMARASR